MLNPNPDHRTDDLTSNPNDPPQLEQDNPTLDFCIYCKFDLPSEAICNDPSKCVNNRTRTIIDMM